MGPLLVAFVVLVAAGIVGFVAAMVTPRPSWRDAAPGRAPRRVAVVAVVVWLFFSGNVSFGVANRTTDMVVGWLFLGVAIVLATGMSAERWETPDGQVRTASLAPRRMDVRALPTLLWRGLAAGSILVMLMLIAAVLGRPGPASAGTPPDLGGALWDVGEGWTSWEDLTVIACVLAVLAFAAQMAIRQIRAIPAAPDPDVDYWVRLRVLARPLRAATVAMSLAAAIVALRMSSELNWLATVLRQQDSPPSVAGYLFGRWLLVAVAVLALAIGASALWRNQKPVGSKPPIPQQQDVSW